MLSQPIHHQRPFPFFLWSSAFSIDQCASLEQMFSHTASWQHREASFYQCSLREVTDKISAEFIVDITSRMREFTGLSLTDKCVVTAQQMLPGHVVGIHSDRPLLGYEIARLVVQLNHDWQPENGGVLELFSSPDGKVEFHVNPTYNSAFGFLLHSKSYHAVTRVNKLRQTLVFNFWHAANTPELETCVKSFFRNMHFSELPAELNSVATLAEASLPEEITFLASTTAIALHRWGLDQTTVVNGYRYSIGLYNIDKPITESQSAILLADWIARLYRDIFDLDQWETLRIKIKHADFFPLLKPIAKLCFPED